MSRPLRLEYPDGWYHVMNRGRRYENIFASTGDYQLFLRVLQETCEVFGLRVSAYCLMPNHYHLLVQTPQANLSRSMRHINGVYAQRFNRRHEIDGPLFRGRFKAVIVEEDSHLLEVMRYIHNNPIKAGLVDTLGDYAWSSHFGYISQAKKYQWLHKQPLLEMLTQNKSQQKNSYLDFVSDESSEETEKFYSMKKLLSVFGGTAFKEKMGNLLRKGGGQEEVNYSSIKPFTLSAERILQEVCHYYGINRDELLRSRRGQTNLPRDIAMYLMQQHRLDTLREIGVYFGIEKYSSVSSGIIRAKKAMVANKQVAKDVFAISEYCSKGQKQT